MSMTRRSILRASLVVAPLLALDPQELFFRPDKQTEKELKAFAKSLKKAMRQMFHDSADDLDVDLSLGATLQAASLTTDTVLLVETLRQPGLYVSGNFTIPASVSFVRLYLNIALADKLATSLFCDLNLYRSNDGGLTWQDPPRTGCGWTSYGPDGYHAIAKDGTPIDNPDPSLGYHVDPEDSTQLFQLRMPLPQPLTLGSTVSVTTG